MRQIKLLIRFDGTAYHGWQVQDNALSIMECMQDALEAVFRERPDIKGCSRTDAGVHANMYCCSFKTGSDIDCFRLQGALNFYLPPDISVFSAGDVALDFHPRYSCIKKEYVYKIYNSTARNPFYRDRALHYRPHIDEALLNAAVSDFCGTHDFTSFCGAKSEITDCVRTVFDASVKREGELLTFTVSGDGFLYNMVRIMTGTLLAVNEGKISFDSIPEIIEKKDRKAAGKTAPACGLYLNRVFYGGDSLV